MYGKCAAAMTAEERNRREMWKVREYRKQENKE